MALNPATFAIVAPGSAPPTLQRALGRWDLTAIGINMVVGVGVFLVPSQVAAQVGWWSPIACVFLGVVSLLIGLCFAELGSRFETTGGPYLYTRAAFGRFAGFEVAWLYWFTRATAQASVMNGLVLALAFYWPRAAATGWRVAIMTGLTAFLTWVNVRGIRQTAWMVNALTVGKLLPLGAFVVVGLFFANFRDVQAPQPISWAQGSTATLLLLFIFSGYEVIAVPGGETTDPRRDVPFAIVATILTITAVNTLVFTVVMVTLPNVAASQTPVADAAFRLVGAAGALLIGVGSVISIAGTNAGQILSGSRMLFALAEHGDLPRFLARVHPTYRTPTYAVVSSAAVALTLALSGSFVGLAAASGVARLVTYAGVCASTIALRHPRYAGVVQPARYVAPGGLAIPVLATALSLGILIGVTREQALAGAGGLVAGALLFGIAHWPARRVRSQI